MSVLLRPDFPARQAGSHPRATAAPLYESPIRRAGAVTLIDLVAGVLILAIAEVAVIFLFFGWAP